MKKRYSFFGILIAIFLLVSCSTEENIEQQNLTPEIVLAKNWFESHKENYKDPIFQYVKEIQWNNAIYSEGKKGEVVEIPLILTDKIRAANNKTNQLKDYHRLVLMRDENEEFVPFYVQIFTDKQDFNNLDPNFNYYNINSNFDGLVNVYDLSKEVTISKEFENGIRTKPNITAKDGEYATCLYFGWWYEDGHFEVISTVGCTIGGGGGEVGGTGGYGSTGSGGITTSNTNQVNSIPNKQVLIELIESASSEGYDFTFVQNQNTTISSVKIKLLPWAGLLFNINQAKGLTYTVQNVTSGAYGLTLGYSWNQNDYSVSVSGNTTSVTVYGILEYTIFYEGVGTIYSEQLSYRININNRTGRIISGIRI